MRLFDASRAAFDIGDGAGHAQDAVVSACRRTELVARTFEPVALGLRQCAIALEVHDAEFGIRLARTQQRFLARLQYPLANRRAVVVVWTARRRQVGDRDT